MPAKHYTSIILLEEYKEDLSVNPKSKKYFQKSLTYRTARFLQRDRLGRTVNLLKATSL